MIMPEIRKIATKLGIKTTKLNKTALVRKIQTSEGNFDCFATASSNYCDQPDCVWRTDCLKLAKQNK